MKRDCHTFCKPSLSLRIATYNIDESPDSNHCNRQNVCFIADIILNQVTSPFSLLWYHRTFPSLISRMYCACLLMAPLGFMVVKISCEPLFVSSLIQVATVIPKSGLLLIRNPFSKIFPEARRGTLMFVLVITYESLVLKVFSHLNDKISIH